MSDRPEGTDWVDDRDEERHYQRFDPEESRDDWKTPPSVWQPMGRAVGGWNLDPCTGPDADDIATDEFHERGAQREWHGRVWVNPPFSSIPEWVDAAIRETSEGRAETVVLLVPATRTSASWWHRALDHAIRLCLPESRIDFYNEDGDESSAPMPIAFFVFGETTDDLDAHLQSLGWTVDPAAGMGDRTESSQAVFSV